MTAETKINPTKEAYNGLDRAYAHFNRRLFGAKLPRCIITMQRRKNAYGYFHAGVWRQAGGKAHCDEIALNPDHFRGRTTADVLSTLVHEMVHLQQQHQGKPSRTGYHNKQWAEMMLAVGLTPTDTGKPGGKMTGQAVTHMIGEGGKFQRALAGLKDVDAALPWHALTSDDDDAAAKKKRKTKSASKTKYSCPDCGLNAWGKPDLNLACGDCEQPLEAEA